MDASHISEGDFFSFFVVLLAVEAIVLDKECDGFEGVVTSFSVPADVVDDVLTTHPLLYFFVTLDVVKQIGDDAASSCSVQTMLDVLV